MSLLAVAVQFYGRPRVAFRVPPGAFHPVPKVESAVVHIEVYPPGELPVPAASEERFFRVVRAGFSEKRKQIANTLASGLGLPKEQVVARLRGVGVDPTRRAETLALQEWEQVEGALGGL
jgi:16S rRNA (adenine1518-N6/adenine1519-N6)-dimethyltransferase